MRSSLTEDQVVDAIEAHLKQAGWDVLSTAKNGRTGIDVHAVRDGINLEVEAKGARAGKSGNSYSYSLVRQHVARAIYPALEAVSRGHRGAIALPDDDAQRDAVKRVRPALDSLSISVFWVAEDGTVSEGS